METQRMKAIKLDITELKKFLNESQRQHVKDVLSLDIRRLETELQKLEINSHTNSISTAKVQQAAPCCYDVKLTNYAWDQSDKFVKIFVTLKNVHSLKADKVACSFTQRSMELQVKELDGRNYFLPIKNLLEEINPEKSHWKVKSDMVVIFLSKESSKQWAYVTLDEKRLKEKRTPKFEPGGDPMEGLMGMLKQMHDEGDDEMKRTIEKAWVDSQQKKSHTEMDF